MVHTNRLRFATIATEGKFQGLMNKEIIRALTGQIGIIPAIRLSSAQDALFAVRAAADSGIPLAEVTLTIPGAVE